MTNVWEIKASPAYFLCSPCVVSNVHRVSTISYSHASSDHMKKRNTPNGSPNNKSDHVKWHSFTNHVGPTVTIMRKRGTVRWLGLIIGCAQSENTPAVHQRLPSTKKWTEFQSIATRFRGCCVWRVGLANLLPYQIIIFITSWLRQSVINWSVACLLLLFFFRSFGTERAARNLCRTTFSNSNRRGKGCVSLQCLWYTIAEHSMAENGFLS